MLREALFAELAEAEHRARATGSPKDGGQPSLHFEQRERLGDVVVGAELKAGELVLLGGAGGEEHHGTAVAEIPHRTADVEAGPGRLRTEVEHHVEHRDVGRHLAEEVERLDLTAGAEGVVALALEEAHEGVEDLRFIFNEEHARHQVPLPSGGPMGSVMWKVVPSPSTLSTLTRPPWASTM